MTEDLPGDLARWIGRSETSEDMVTAGVSRRLEATLDAPPELRGKDDELRPLGHWCLFLPESPTSELGPDGHAARGGFLPPVHHLPRRMWAGSRLQFLAPLKIGMRVERRSTITAITRKSGASGELVFVTARHEISEAGGALLVTDEHDIVYRGLAGAAVKPAAPPPPAGAWRREIVPDAVLLFRYSALTFNGHRIHYDRPYVTGVEGYPGLIVHGPLVATLLLDLVPRFLPGARIATYNFKALSPVFDGLPLTLNGTSPDADGVIKLWATKAEGGLAMMAQAQLS